MRPAWYKGFRQPTGTRLAIDWDHPLAQGLQFATVFNTAGRARSLVRGGDADTQHLLSDSELGYGRAASSGADTLFSRVLSQTVLGRYDGSLRISIVAGCENNTNGNVEGFRIGELPGSSNTYRARWVNWTSTKSKMSFLGGWSSQGVTPATLFDLSPQPKPWLWAWDQLSTEYRFSDGIQYAEGTGTGGHENDTSTRDEMDFLIHDSTQLDRLSYVYLWNKLLSVGDHQWVGSEPYAFIVPEAIRLYSLGSAPAAGTSITVADATAAAAADTVAITQVHALTAAGDTAAAGAADAPALTQAHDVLVGTADTAAGADTPTIGQVHALIAAGATAAPATDAPAVTQVHALSVADATAASAADLVALPAPDEHDLVVGEAAAAAAVDALAITQAHSLAAADAAAGADADAASVSQTHALVTGDTAATPGADAVAVSQAHDLVVSAPYVEPGVDVVALLQTHALSVEDAIAAGHADAVAWYAQSLGEIVNPQVVVLTARRDLAAITAARHAAAITTHRTVKRLH